MEQTVNMRFLIMGLIITALLIVSAGIYTLLSFHREVVQPGQEGKPSQPVVASSVKPRDAVNGFAFKIFKEMYKNFSEENLFISPYSIFTALAMTYEGARGKTAEEMREVLCIEQDNETFHEYVKMLYDLFNENNISTANALWPRIGLQLVQDYVNVIRTFYNGEIKPIDFSDREKAARIINDWIENQTKGLIKDMIPPNAIDPYLTTLIITNAIHFKGIWKVKFDEANTTDREFTTADNEVIKVPTMCLKGVYFNYTENDLMQVLELPYENCSISMLIILPKEGYNLSSVLDYLNESNFLQLVQSMHETKIDVYLPRFKIETPLYKLKEYLKNLGMRIAFTPSADFTGIAPRVMWIDKVLHKAFVEVDEEGTEAAAATAVIMVEIGKIFDCNHPFLFTIFHKDTGTILFIGSVVDPRSD